jgi:division protein CdvB (Snf7/Vps24/ESCRT-III family)
LKEIANAWRKECEELRKFAELEREAFQSVIDEVTLDLSKKDERVQILGNQVLSLECEQVLSIFSWSD